MKQGDGSGASKGSNRTVPLLSLTAQRQNIILCTCDQLRAFEIGCCGKAVICTSNIDNLAARGMRFETSLSNCPSCTPARSSLLSEQYSRTCAGALQNVPLKFEIEYLYGDGSSVNLYLSQWG